MKKRNQDQMGQTNSRSGYTLTELMVVVGIIAILGSTAFVSMARKMPEMRDEKATSELIAKVRQVRLEAITRDQPVEWWITGEQLRYWFDWDEDGSEDAGEVESLWLDDRGRYSTYPRRGKFDSRGEVIPSSSYPGVILWSYQKTKVDLLTISSNGHIRKHSTY